MKYGVTGNFTGIVTTNSYNKRLQPLILSATSPSQTVLSLSYDFRLGNGNNGNVFQIINNRDNNRSAGFSYDALNRIAFAWSSGALWGERFEIDPWGNLNKIRVCQPGDPCEGKPQGENLDQLADEKNRFLDFCYDAAGNLMKQGPCPGGDYVYDAENRLKTAAGVTYTYDGDGRRVKKDSGKLYWTGTGSDPLEENDLSGAVTEQYVFFNGKRIARLEGTGASLTIHYYFSDHLGSASVITNADGSTVEQEADYYPYGGERVITAGMNAYKFTGKERDAETGLDYFGARDYSNGIGRFLVTDPGDIGMGHIIDPQKWNGYAYTINNPIVLNDRDGRVELEFRITAQIESDMTHFPVPAKGGVKYQQKFRIETDPSKNSTGLESYEPYVGPSEGIGITEEAGCIPLAWTSGQASTDGISPAKQSVSRDGEGNVVIEANASVAYPLLPAPAIDSMYTIIVGPDGTIKYWSTSHDRFPSHILEWRKVGEPSWRRLYSFRPKWFDTALNLFPFASNKEEKRGKKPHRLREEVTHRLIP